MNRRDFSITIGDTVGATRVCAYAEDTGMPMVVVHHGTFEEFGVKGLAGQLRISLPNYEIIHFQQGCGHKWIAS